MYPLLKDIINLLYSNSKFELIIMGKYGDIEKRMELSRQEIIEFINNDKNKVYKFIMMDIQHDENLKIFEEYSKYSHFRQKIYIAY